MRVGRPWGRCCNMMEYKGYVAKIEFDDEDDVFHGEVINLRDVIIEILG